VLLVLLLHTVLLSYPWGWAERGFWRSVHRLAGDVALWRGDLDAAAQAYEQALAAQRTADGWIALGDVQLARGDLEAAAAAYELAWRKERLYYPASARLGAVLRTLGGREAAARRAFEGTNVPEQAVLDWSWAQLAAQPGARVDVGGGLDFGYVGGMYPAEIQQGASARWTNGHGRLRVALPAPLQGANEQLPVLVGLRLAAPHPAARQVTAHVCLGNCCQQAQLTPRWRTIWLLLPPRRASPASHADARAVLELDLYSPTFTAADGRTLGVLVDWVAAVPAREPRPSSQ
jgi:tetratricopeptide (TPR) repeat protein